MLLMPLAMVVRHDRTPKKGDINRFYADDYKPLIPDFQDRSTKMLSDMIARVLSEKGKLRRAVTLYFHNFSRFDGIILLRHLALYLPDDLTIKPVVRNSRIYEIAVYLLNPLKNRLILKIRDSCLLLPGSLADLADSFCPKAGGKGEIDHVNVTVDKLGINRKKYLDYLDQDILLLGRVVQKAQKIYWDEYLIDIVSEMTISSLAMTIFRMKYYDDVHPLMNNGFSFIQL